MKKGFTLAEVLITLGIVGIVAVLTVPGVMKNYANRMYVAQLQKVYSQVSEAAQSIMNDEHTDTFSETLAASNTNPTGCPADKSKCTSGVYYFLNNYFKTIKTNCGATGDSTCAKGANFYRKLDNTYITGSSTNCVQTVSGAAICANYNSANKCMSLIVDVNGIAQPNVAGRDVFSMDIRQNGSISDYGSGCVNNSAGASASSCGTGVVTSVAESAKGCLNNIIEAGWKMEY
jgi:prepilin-type N-terminal cleavage/methylation domain-containing protein